MQALAVVENFDVVVCRGSRVRDAGPVVVMGPFLLEGPEEALDHGVVEAVTSTAHAASDAMLLEERLVRPAGVLSATIGVMYELGRRRTRVQRVDQRSFDQLRAHVGRHRPS